MNVESNNHGLITQAITLPGYSNESIYTRSQVPAVGKDMTQFWGQTEGVTFCSYKHRSYKHSRTNQWRIQGGPGPPIFGKVNFIFFTLYTMSGKNIFEIEFGFYSGRNPRSFGSMGGVYVCVWIEIVAATVFCSVKPHFEWYPKPFQPQNICQIA